MNTAWKVKPRTIAIFIEAGLIVLPPGKISVRWVWSHAYAFEVGFGPRRETLQDRQRAAQRMCMQRLRTEQRGHPTAEFPARERARKTNKTNSFNHGFHG